MAKIEICTESECKATLLAFAHLLNELGGGVPLAAADVVKTPVGAVEKAVATPSAEDIEAAAYAAQVAADEQEARDDALTDDVPIDTNGVPKDDEFCGNAAIPFYSSGKRPGQWKKRQGVADAAYDAWYVEALAALPEADAFRGALADAAGDDISDAAFGNTEAAGADTAPAAPTTAGEFMTWVAEQQTAGHFTAEEVLGAYATAGVAVVDLFPPNTVSDVAKRVAAVYAVLA